MSPSLSTLSPLLLSKKKMATKKKVRFNEEINVVKLQYYQEPEFSESDESKGNEEYTVEEERNRWHSNHRLWHHQNKERWMRNYTVSGRDHFIMMNDLPPIAPLRNESPTLDDVISVVVEALSIVQKSPLNSKTVL
jgi:hypothetical protein